MSKVDWSLAPSDAQYGGIYEGKFSCWYMRDGDQWFYSSNISGAWEKVFDNRPSSDLIQRPQPKPWSGPEDGLPPLGTELEFKVSSGKWWKATVFAVKYNTDESADVLIDHQEGWAFVDSNSHRLRALKTPEQLAAEERERAIADLRDHIAHANFRRSPSLCDEELAKQLYGAGFRRERDPDSPFRP